MLSVNAISKRAAPARPFPQPGTNAEAFCKRLQRVPPGLRRARDDRGARGINKRIFIIIRDKESLFPRSLCAENDRGAKPGAISRQTIQPRAPYWFELACRDMD